MSLKTLSCSFIITLGAICSIVFSQEINLQGKVIDQYGAPVSQAQLSLQKLSYFCYSNKNGNFNLDKNSSGIISANSAAGGFIGLTPKFLELGNCYEATITVFSIRGALINRVAVTNQNRISIDKLVPASCNSQAIIFSIATGGRTINVKAVKCAASWSFNDNSVVRISRAAAGGQAAASQPVDTLIILKDNMKVVKLPVTALVATLPDIVMNYIVDPHSTDPNDSATIIGDVTFSEPSKTFKTALSVTLSTTIAGAEIRYTTDGLAPTAASALYSSPIAISQTTQLRAAAFIAGTQFGRPSTAIYIARDFDYTSEIPIIILEGYGGGKPTDKYNFIDLGFMSFEPVGNVASLDNAPTIATRAGYHLRGQSSMSFKQTPYRVELWDNADNDADYPLCGMPKSADWAFVSPCTDNTLIRNVFVFDLGKSMGLATVQYRFAEVFINEDGGALNMSDYEGIYAVIQPIKNRKTTLDLKSLKPSDTDPSKLSGGYLFKFDQAVTDTDMFQLECTGAKKMTGMGWGRVDTTATCYADLELIEPSEPNRQQVDWITGYIQEFHNSLHGNPAGDWQKYIDLNSFVNIHILNEFTCNVDAWIRSHHMYKDRNMPITAGPVWDYNFALGNYARNRAGWHIDSNRVGSNDWNTRMWKQPAFKTAFKNRYTELRKSVLSDDSIIKLIDKVKKPIDNIAERNFTAWPMGKCNRGGGGFLDKKAFFQKEEITDSTWAGQVDSLKTWSKKRLQTLDSMVTTLP